MSSPTTPESPQIVRDDAHEKQRALAAGLCASQLARTLKTCRLYDAANPTALRFRQELADTLVGWLAEHGSLKLDFTARDVLWSGHSLYPAKSREDNLGMPFFREGLRSVTLVPGLEKREVDAFVDVLLAVTSHANESSDDLVAMLWDADLPHLDMTYVSAEADFESGAEDDTLASAADERFPWPGAGAGVPTSGTAAPAVVQGADDTDGPTRSEDWIASEAPLDIEAVFLELQADADAQVRRLSDEWRAEHTIEPLAASLEMVREARLSGLKPEDREDLSSFLVRLLREALSNAAWLQARAILDELHGVTERHWDAGPLLAELAHPESVLTARLVRTLDSQGLPEIQDFLEIARALGASATEWLMAVLAKSENRRTRQTVAKALAELCRQDPERLAPWVLDERWYVTRNVVYVLGLVGGPAIVGLLRPILRHPDPRVGIEIVRALEPLELELSRPLLLELLPGADGRVFGAALHRLAARRDPEIARLVYGWMRAPDFRERPPEQQRAIYSALGGAGDDSLLPELEQDLNATKWLDAHHAAHCQSLARSIARFGTPASRAVLEHGATSRSAPVRQACRAALESIGHG